MRIIAVLLVSLLAGPMSSFAQGVNEPEIWRGFAEKLTPGTTLKVRLATGERFKATLLQVSAESMTVQAKTRVPVAPQLVRFADVRSLEVDEARNTSLVKAVAVGAATAAGAFFALLAIAFAASGD